MFNFICLQLKISLFTSNGSHLGRRVGASHIILKVIKPRIIPAMFSFLYNSVYHINVIVYRDICKIQLTGFKWKNDNLTLIKMYLCINIQTKLMKNSNNCFIFITSDWLKVRVSWIHHIKSLQFIYKLQTKNNQIHDEGNSILN
jgi:hypothetical protein